MDEIEIVTVHDLISVDSALSLSEQFESLREPLENRISELLAMECTEDSRKHIKEERAMLRRTRQAFSDEVNSIKKQVLRPWDAVESKAKELIRLMDEADVRLKQKVDDVESGIKQRALEEVRAYFEEKRLSLGIGEWCTFESMRLPILMSDSMKKRLDAVDDYLEKIHDDLELIWSHESSAECFDEYISNGFSAVKAITAVQDRHERIAKAEASRPEQTKTEEPSEKLPEAVREALSPPKVSAPSEEKELPEKTEKVHILYKMAFQVKGTLPQLKALKHFLIENNIEILND